MTKWKQTNYLNNPKMFNCKKPLLFFSMQLDSNKHVIPGLNTGRLSLWDYELGMIYRWVATSSYASRQSVNNWNITGGIHPPNQVMLGSNWFHLKNTRIIQPGQPVDDGFILYYNGSNNWQTVSGAKRSQIMLHEDKERNGTYGCIGMSKSEYDSFTSVLEETCEKDIMIPMGISYSW
ncbi:MAG: hypothetical protein HC907_30165 [Richelia sp. SM1_7_0]|nr:hypothetical protein [Richelia sp. SM1_7_0]